MRRARQKSGGRGAARVFTLSGDDDKVNTVDQATSDRLSDEGGGTTGFLPRRRLMAAGEGDGEERAQRGSCGQAVKTSGTLLLRSTSDRERILLCTGQSTVVTVPTETA